MNTELDVWSALQRGEKLKLEDVASCLYGVDVSGYIQTVYDLDLPRFRVNKVSCDGTAVLTLLTLHEMIEPIINMKVYDKTKGEPKGNETFIKYKCSPIEYECSIDGVKQIDRFYIKYSSEFVYE